MTTGLPDAIDYSLEGGKGYRSQMAACVARRYNLEIGEIQPLLIGIDNLHAASLVIDDLPMFDDASERRGRDATHMRYGEQTALLAAVGIVARVFTNITGMDFPRQRLHQMECYMRYAGEQMSDGQLLEKKLMGKGDYAELEHIAGLKTGYGFALCLVPPAILGGASQSECDLLESAGRNLGIAYQIADDITDLEKDKQIGVRTVAQVLGREEASIRAIQFYQSAIGDLREVGRMEELETMLHRLVISIKDQSPQ